MDKNDPRRPITDEELDALNEHWHDPGDPDGVFEAEQRKKWRAEHPVPVPTPRATRKKRHRLAKAFLVLIVIAAAAVGAYWFGNNKAEAPAKQTSATNQPATPKTSAVPSAATKHYDSTNFTLGFDYPETWKVADTATKLTVTSPALQFQLIDGTKQTVHIQLAIQNQQTAIAGYPVNGGVAELVSDKLSYKNPSAIQRAQTYVSYIGYAKADGLDAIFVTGDTGYQQGQQVPLSDLVKGNPLVSVAFLTCTSIDCQSGNSAAVTLLASQWENSTAGKAIAGIIESIVLN